jgi:hypothetical protein
MRFVLHVIDADDPVAAGGVEIAGPLSRVSGIPGFGKCVTDRLRAALVREVAGLGIVVEDLSEALGRQLGPGGYRPNSTLLP